MLWTPLRAQESVGSKVVRPPSGTKPLRGELNRPGPRRLVFGSQDAPLQGVLGLENLSKADGFDGTSGVDLIRKLFEIAIDVADSSPWSPRSECQRLARSD